MYLNTLSAKSSILFNTKSDHLIFKCVKNWPLELIFLSLVTCQVCQVANANILFLRTSDAEIEKVIYAWLI